MDESEEIYFVDSLSEEYELAKDLVVKRFHSVERLSKSIYFGKKIEELYCNSKQKVKTISK